MRRLLIFMALLMFTSQSFAFMEQYFFYDDEERSELNGPSLIDGEYYSDQLAFRLSNQNQLNFFKNDNAYDISLGSVSSTRFSMQQRLKLNNKISDKLNFNLAYVEREDLEVARSHLAVGLSYEVSPLFTVSTYTSLFSSKSDNDLGFAGTLYFNPDHELTLFYTFTDFSFNERTEESVVNTSSSNHIGFLGRYSASGKNFLEYYILRNMPLSKKFEVLQNVYSFEEWRYGFRGIKEINKTLNLNFDVEAFDTRETLLEPSMSTDIEREGVRSLFQVESMMWIYGLEFNFRRWLQAEGKVFHRNLMPHIWYKMRLNKYTTSLDFGLEASIHSASGERSLRSATDRNSAVETRFNMRVNFLLSERSFLNLILSMDLDDGSWEGGGGQFQILF